MANPGALKNWASDKKAGGAACGPKGAGPVGGDAADEDDEPAEGEGAAEGQETDAEEALELLEESIEELEEAFPDGEERSLVDQLRSTLKKLKAKVEESEGSDESDAAEQGSSGDGDGAPDGE